MPARKRERQGIHCNLETRLVNIASSSPARCAAQDSLVVGARVVRVMVMRMMVMIMMVVGIMVMMVDGWVVMVMMPVAVIMVMMMLMIISWLSSPFLFLL